MASAVAHALTLTETVYAAPAASSSGSSRYTVVHPGVVAVSSSASGKATLASARPSALQTVAVCAPPSPAAR